MLAYLINYYKLNESHKRNLRKLLFNRINFIFNLNHSNRKFQKADFAANLQNILKTDVSQSLMMKTSEAVL